MSSILNKLKGNVKLIESSDEVRVQKCQEAVMTICDQWDCLLVPSMTIQGCQATGYRFNGDVGIVPVPRKAPDEKK